jgi:hypothetical protein
MPILNAAPLWKAPRSRYITLWHGCISDDKDMIERTGIDVTRGRIDTDFGRGFYTTTVKRQARHWAWLRHLDPSAARKKGRKPVILRFRLHRNKLAQLANIAFVWDHMEIRITGALFSIVGRVQRLRSMTKMDRFMRVVIIGTMWPMARLRHSGPNEWQWRIPIR